MRPHLLWFVPVVLTLHCAEGSSFEKGDGNSGAGADATGGGGQTGDGGATSGSGGASTTSGTASVSSSGGGGAQDPCAGISCATAPPNVCKDASYLTVKETPGTCTNGSCVYVEHDEWCAFGCSMGACNGDPCAGISCNMPPTNYCAGPNSRVVYASPGTCSNGTCAYASSQENCANGCVMGVCNGDPCSGVTCNSPPPSTCADANTMVAYAAMGTCSGGTCSYTSSNVVCPAGCMNGACNECSTNADCPSGKWCNQSLCQTCNTAAHCGTSCVACGGGTPQCLNGSTCVQCVTANDCPAGQQCGAGNTCLAGCTPPAAACTTGGSVDGGCAAPRLINRTTAGSASGFSQSTYGLCGRANDFPSGGGCNGGGADGEYRLFMRAGESVQTIVTKAGYCNMSASGNITLKVFQAACDAACGCPVPTTCPSSARVVCQAGASSVGQSITNNYTADKDGWYTFVVDTEISTDNNFQFTMTLKLTCGAAGCGC